MQNVGEINANSNPKRLPMAGMTTSHTQVKWRNCLSNITTHGLRSLFRSGITTRWRLLRRKWTHHLGLHLASRSTVLMCGSATSRRWITHNLMSTYRSQPHSHAGKLIVGDYDVDDVLGCQINHATPKFFSESYEAYPTYSQTRLECSLALRL